MVKKTTKGIYFSMKEGTIFNLCYTKDKSITNCFRNVEETEEIGTADKDEQRNNSFHIGIRRKEISLK